VALGDHEEKPESTPSSTRCGYGRKKTLYFAWRLDESRPL
jgi:hypothetical protein